MAIKPADTILANHLSLSQTIWLSPYFSSFTTFLPSFTSDIPAVCLYDAGQSIRLLNFAYGEDQDQTRNLALDWADMDEISGAVILGAYIYVLMEDSGTSPDTWRLYRYAKNNLAGGATLMTFSGSNQLTQSDANLRLMSDGTNLLISCLAGNSANQHEIAKYSISGTTLTYVSSVTLGSTSGEVDSPIAFSSGEFGAMDTADGTIRRYDSSGNLLGTTGTRDVTNMTSGLYLLMDSYAYLGFFKTATGMDEFTMTRVPVPVA